MALIDWQGLLRLGLSPLRLGGLGLRPETFWRLTPRELMVMAGHEDRQPLLRQGLQALMAAYPDLPNTGVSDARDRHGQREADGT